MTKISYTLLSCLVLTAALLTAMPAGAQLQPSSEVLLPYFEVNLQKASASNTLLDVGNALAKPVDVEITVATNWGIQITKINLKLAAHEVRSFNLRSWIAGDLPGKRMTVAETNHFKAALTGQRSPKDNLFYASQVAPGIAVGSVRIKTLGKPQPDALWGTYFLIDSDQSAGAGDTLVNLDPGTGCFGGCRDHALRFLTAGAFDGGTQVVVWSDVAAKPSASSQPAGYVQADTLAFDESGQALGGNRLRLLPLQVVSVGELGLRQPSGSLDLQTEATSVVAVHYSSKNRFGISLMSYCLPTTFGSIGPGIRLEKRTNGQDANTPPGPSIRVGQPVFWEYIVENTGDAALSDIQVSDDKGVSVSCPQTTLGLGERMTCTGRGVAEACQYKNLGTVTARTPTNETVTAEDPSHYFGDQNAAIDVELLVNGEDADTPTGPKVSVGSKINWTYIVTNQGDVALNGIKVSDALGATVSCPKSTLRPSESMTCTGSGTAVKGQIKNVGSVTGQSPCGEETDEDPGYYLGGDDTTPPGLSIKKLTNNDDSQAAPGKSIPAGGQVRWDYIVSNTGKVRLDKIVVTDDREGTVSCPKTSLQPGESMTCSKTGVAKACQYSNVGTVTAASSGGAAVTASDQSWYVGQTSPAIKVKTYTNDQDADTGTGPEIVVGSPVKWTYTVTNSGNVALRNVRVTDDHQVSVSCPKTSLQPGESMTCSANGVAVEGQYTNVGTAAGTADTSCGGDVSASDPSHYLGKPQPQPPGISIKKLTNSNDCQSGPGQNIPVGGQVRWDYIVTNTGQVRLDSVKVTDDKEGVVSCPKTSLQPGESMTCSKTGVAKACQYNNVGTVTATSPAGAAVSANDSSWYFGQTNPDLKIKTYTNGQDANSPTGPEISVGSPVQWTYTVTNTGNVALRNVQVTDDHGVSVSCPKTSLQPGESMTCSASGVAVQGQYKNIGTVTGTADTSCGGNASASDASHYFGKATQPPSIAIKKLTNSNECHSGPGQNIPVGGSVRWDYIVTNTGNVRLDSVKVTDDKEGVVSCPKSSLQPNESMTCSKTGVAKACQYSNVGTVTATSSTGTPVSANDSSWYFGQTNPGIKVKAYTNGQDADTGTGPDIPVGSPVQWTYTVTNSGNVALRDVRVTDNRLASVSCPKSTLQTGESMTCSANGVAVEGQYTNVGTATGTADTSCGGNVSASDPSRYRGINNSNHPPSCNAAKPSDALLWPPNHSMKNIDILAVTDPDQDPVTVKIDGITQDEPVNSWGDGNTETDGAGVGTSRAQVRAERSGQGNGRVYVIRYTAQDNKGGSCSGAVSVGVPHDQSGAPPVDSGQLYDSTKP